MSTQAQQAGTPNPVDGARRVARPLWPTDMTFVSGVPVGVLVPLAGALSWRLRWLSAVGGTLVFRYRRPAPYQGTAYQTAHPPSQSVTGGTEVVVDITPRGEAYLYVEFQPAASGALTYADQMQV